MSSGWSRGTARRVGRLAVVSTVVAVLLPLGPPGAGAAPSALAGNGAVPGEWGLAYPVRLNPVSALGESTRIGALATTVRDETVLLHAVTTGAGRREYSSLLAYGRTADEGRTWTGRTRLSPATHKVLNGAVAASGSHVYVAWLRKLPANAGTTVYLRTNSSHGRPSSWSRTRLLGRGTDSSVLTTMSITATGSVVVVGTLAQGRVVLWTSRDRGRSWSDRVVGSTASAPLGSGRGTVAVASSGRLMATVWTVWTTEGKQTRARISRDRGRHWSKSHVVAPCCGTPSLAVAGGRVTVAVGVNKDHDSVPGSMVTWRRGAWGPRRTLPLPTGADSVNPVVALHGDRTVGMAYVVDAGVVPQSMVLRWRESPDDGTTWSEPVEVYPPTGSYWVPSSYPVSVLWRAPGPLHLLYSRIDADDQMSTAIVTRR